LEEQIIRKYVEYLNPYVYVKKAWLELDNDHGYKACCLYDGLWDNEVNYTFMDTFDRQEAIQKMQMK
jgi:hypothetical protein